MLFDRFLRTISDLIGGDPIAGDRGAALARLDPDKFYLENVRAILGVSHKQATRIIETAVRQGVFATGVEVRCPDGTVPVTAATEAELPATVRCWREDEAGHVEEEWLQTSTLPKATFYRLRDVAQHH